jgi:hypothetical protein
MAVNPVVKEAIITFLHGQAGPVTEPTIKQGVTGDNWAKQNALRALVAEGRVMRQGSGTRGHPIISHWLTPARTVSIPRVGRRRHPPPIPIAAEGPGGISRPRGGTSAGPVRGRRDDASA